MPGAAEAPHLSRIRLVGTTSVAKISGERKSPDRNIVKALGIPTRIPREFLALRNAARRRGARGGPSTVAKLRNELVHAKKQRRGNTELRRAVLFEARELSLGYIELALLAILEYKGRYGLEATKKKIEQTIASAQTKIEEDLDSLLGEFADLKKPTGNRDEAFQLDERSQHLRSRQHSVQTEIITLRNQIKILEEKLERAVALRQELDEHKGKMTIARTLAQALHGDEFIAFIQQEAYRRLAADGSRPCLSALESRPGTGI